MTTQYKFLKNRPVPGRLSKSPVMCKSLKSYDVSFICDHSITHSTIKSVLSIFRSCCRPYSVPLNSKDTVVHFDSVDDLICVGKTQGVYVISKGPFPNCQS